MYQMMATTMEQIEPALPPEVQSELKMLQRNDPQGYENQVKQLISQQQPRPYTNNVEGVM
jgi:hypothetical protein